MDGLPFIDEHHVLVAAPASVVWRALASTAGRIRGETYARLVGAQPWRTSGQPLAEGATLPGFEVEQAVPERSAKLAGRHRFSRYTLTMTLDEQSGGTRLTALTHAEFPGPLGWIYRQLVISSGAHHVLVGRLLRDIGRRAERLSHE